jgi:hypothetical protein
MEPPPGSAPVYTAAKRGEEAVKRENDELILPEQPAAKKGRSPTPPRSMED